MKLILNKVTKSYRSVQALQKFSMIFEPGIYALLGPNGSGKSTLMNLITDNLKPDSGSIQYVGANGVPEDTVKMGAGFREKIGFMPQYPGMYPDFSTEDFLWYMAAMKDMDAGLKTKERKAKIAEEIREILFAVELDDFRHRKIRALSGGMKQRLALAQAVLGNPEILILDEPTAGLDPKQRIAIRNFISRISLEKIVIIATHVVSDVEFIAKEVVILKNGKIHDQAAPHILTSKVDGMVWNMAVEQSEITAAQSKFRVINLTRDEESDKILLRVLSSEKPSPLSVKVTPTLEDYYLYSGLQ